MSRIRYVLRESRSNLLRNLTLTLAAVATVAVSLSLFGGAMLFRQGVDNATARWKGGIEFIVFLDPAVTGDQRDAIEADLLAHPDVKRIDYVDQDEAHEEFSEMFARSPEMVENISPDVLPPSFRVVPAVADDALISGIAADFDGAPGVREIVAAYDTVKTVERLSSYMSTGVMAVALFLLATSTLLILNTVRMAVYARRREIEVMKLVGATDWYVRVPFMIEGVTQGVLGGGVAVGAVLLVNRLLGTLSDGRSFRLLQGFQVDADQVQATAVAVVVIGVAVGAVSSALAVRRFLKV